MNKEQQAIARLAERGRSAALVAAGWCAAGAVEVNGNGVNPEMEDILAVAEKTGLNVAKSQKTANEIKECVYEMLGEYIK